MRRPLGWDLAPADVLRLVRDDAHPVALFGAWAGGGDVVASEPLLVRQAGDALGDVLDAPFPSGPGGPGEQAGVFGGGWIGYLGYSAGGEALPASGPRALPAWWFGYYDHVLRRDQESGEWFFEALSCDERATALEDRLAALSARAGPAGGCPGWPGCPRRPAAPPAPRRGLAARTCSPRSGWCRARSGTRRRSARRSGTSAGATSSRPT